MMLAYRDRYLRSTRFGFIWSSYFKRLQNKYRVPSSRFAQIYLRSGETQLTGTRIAEIVQIVVQMFNAQLFRHKYWYGSSCTD